MLLSCTYCDIIPTQGILLFAVARRGNLRVSKAFANFAATDKLAIFVCIICDRESVCVLHVYGMFYIILI